MVFLSYIYHFYHFLLAWSGSIFYKRPSRELFVLGVTGTKGKTTALEIMRAILDESGNLSAMMTTVSQKIAYEEIKKSDSNTMPGRWKIQRFLKKSAEAGCKYALLEVTSQGVSQHRHRFIEWDGAIFLNIHPEHIESHGSFEKYREAKLGFFRYLKHSEKSPKYFFINKDDSDASLFGEATDSEGDNRVIFFGAGDVQGLVDNLRKESSADWLAADFNLINIAAAVAFAKEVGVSDEDIKNALLNFRGVVGRMDVVRYEPFTAVVDYAHTPDSLRAIYKTLRKNYLSRGGKLICVLGSAGGGRDRWKRPELGRVAEGGCDEIILTSEDPYDEKPQDIINDIKKGFSKNSKHKLRNSNIYEITDRKKALVTAVDLARPGDVVVSTGMGSQKWFYGPRGQKLPWNEVEIFKEILENK